MTFGDKSAQTFVHLWDICSQNNQNRVRDRGLVPVLVQSDVTKVRKGTVDTEPPSSPIPRPGASGMYQLWRFSSWQAPSLLPSIRSDGPPRQKHPGVQPRAPATPREASISQPPSEQTQHFNAYLNGTPVVSQDKRPIRTGGPPPPPPPQRGSGFRSPAKLTSDATRLFLG